MEIDVHRPDWELDLLHSLVGKKVRLKEWRDDDVDLPWLASIRTLTFSMLSRGRTRQEARWKIIDAVALERLETELSRMGWSEIERFIDEAEFVVARDPAGRRWGVGASDDDPHRRDWILAQIGLEDDIDLAAVMDYRDIVDPVRIQATLASAGR